MLRMVPNRTIYMHPYERLINAHTSNISAKVRVTGSPAASGVWKMVRIALVHTPLVVIHAHPKEIQVTKRAAPTLGSASSTRAGASR